ncbi:DUF1707 SHOCT-like domain-containing protein [Corynebacterium caspium]|uniref:DUF1707 SHOCT-like domain-containing protein n=1 Tax=Corynebacterium caspium TaxID=234828 RepID=UPI00037D2349|nr:DUF1707 domain-containing protein [Corynebacterium caspium]WKD58616.1 hypothetical protein CCASP_00950 [Corynebacterium caspium DSM 44850]
MENHARRIRLSDEERLEAINLLGIAMGRGQLSVGEFDERCAQVAQTKYRENLPDLFKDLGGYPLNPDFQTYGQQPLPEVLTSRANLSDINAINDASAYSGRVYTAAELAAYNRNGARIRAGIMAITSILAVLLIGAFDDEIMTLLMVSLVAIIAILLYVMRVGPRRWYIPSPRELEKKRMREVAKTQKLRALERREQRREQLNEISNAALSKTAEVLKKKNNPFQGHR